VTLGVWMVPLVLLAAVVLLWVSAWFEGRVAPRESDAQSRTLETVTAFVDAADHTSLGMDGDLVAEPTRPAA
jgi:hypothetical protein